MAIVEASANQPTIRVAPWIIDSVVICPVATAILLILGDHAWGPLVSLASVLTVAIFETVDGLRTSPGYAAEAISLLLAAGLGALAPAASIGASETRWLDKATSTAALFPVWLVVMLTPAAVIFEFSRSLDPSLHPAHLSADFILLFSAAATSVALAYTIWVRHNPDAFIRNRVLPKLPKGPLATGSGRYMGIGVTA